MGFLAPVFLAAGLAIALPIVLHLLRREPEPVVQFPAVRLLRRAPVEHAERRHLRELLLLALRMAALLLLAFAFARPFFTSSSDSAAARVTVVALDTSMSLSAPGQFERARQLGREALERAPAGDLVGVVTFSDAPRIAARPSADRALALAAVDAASAGFGATRYRASIAAAAELMDGRPGSIVVVTDLQAAGWDEGDRIAVPESVAVEVADTGPPPPNLALVEARQEGDRIVASIRNTGSEARNAVLRLTMRSADGQEGGQRDGPAAAESAVSIGAGQIVRIGLQRTPGTLAAVSIDDRDGVTGDNTRFLVLDGRSQPTVVVVSSSGEAGRDAFFVQQALTASGGARGFGVEGLAASRVSTSTALDGAVAVVLMSTRGLDRTGRTRLADFVRKGGGLLAAAGPEMDGDAVADVLGPDAAALDTRPQQAREPRGGDGTRAIAPDDLRHPVFRVFQGNAAALGRPQFDRIATLSARSCQTLARFTTGEVALVECSVGAGRALVFASDLDSRWNNFPRHASFLPFLHESVGYVAVSGAASVDRVVGRAVSGAAGGGMAPSEAVDRPGFVRVPGPGGNGQIWVAVNVDPAETDPTRLSQAEFSAAVTRLREAARADGQIQDRQREEGQHIWQYVLAAMLVIMVVESLVGMRTA